MKTAARPEGPAAADSISIGAIRQLKQRRVEYVWQDLHRGGQETFTLELPADAEIQRLRQTASAREARGVRTARRGRSEASQRDLRVRRDN